MKSATLRASILKIYYYDGEDKEFCGLKKSRNLENLEILKLCDTFMDNLRTPERIRSS